MRRRRVIECQLKLKEEWRGRQRGRRRCCPKQGSWLKFDCLDVPQHYRQNLLWAADIWVVWEEDTVLCFDWKGTTKGLIVVEGCSASGPGQIAVMERKINSDHLSTDSSSTDARSNTTSTWTGRLQSPDFNPTVGWPQEGELDQTFKTTAELQQFCEEEWSKMVFKTIEVVLTPKEKSKIY